MFSIIMFTFSKCNTLSTDWSEIKTLIAVGLYFYFSQFLSYRGSQQLRNIYLFIRFCIFIFNGFLGLPKLMCALKVLI